MTRTGVDDPWRDDEGGREPEELSAWLAEGFTESDAEVWRRWRFRLEEAHAWIAAGVDEGLLAAQWSTAGVKPNQVEQWAAAGITATEAVTWHEFGYGLDTAKEGKAKGLKPIDFHDQGRSSSVTLSSGAGGFTRSQSMRRFMGSGGRPEIAASYMMKQWMDDEAEEWASQNIDASDALLWKELGLSPREAGRLVKQDLTAPKVVRQWWAAGIPVDEVAHWIGAGLSAEEAAEQRAKGITVEQAEALRALRQDDDT